MLNAFRTNRRLTACALILSAPAARTQYLRAKPLLDRTAALLLGALGLKLLLQR